MSRSSVGRGTSYPLGATVQPGGVNFSVYSKNATLVELLLFDTEDALKPERVVSLSPQEHRTYHYWHVFVPDLGPGQVYAFRALGSFDPERGLRFDESKVLLDPYSRAVAVPKAYDRRASNTAVAMKSIVADPGSYDWEGDLPLQRPFVETVTYELHIRGFTRHPSSAVKPEKAGTFAGLIEKIPYLADLGITAVELMPTFQFDAADAPAGHVNFWGYSPVSFFAPHRTYSSRQDALGPIDEFRDMVKALHRAGIEVILDVVFNHTAEGNELGPTFCFRGLGNEAYYLLQRDRSRYADYAGTGNSLNANHPIVRRMIVDSLRYWVTHMHVDGFRFDLASVLARDENGSPLLNPPIIWDIETDPVLAGTKLSRRPGMPEVCIKSAALSETVGRNGTANSATMSDDFLKAIAAPCLIWQPAYWGALTSTATKSGNLSKASTSSPATTASPSTILCLTIRNTMKRMASTIVTG
jgi:isoamylase